MRVLAMLALLGMMFAGCLEADAPANDVVLDEVPLEISFSEEVAALRAEIEAAIANDGTVILPGDAVFELGNLDPRAHTGMEIPVKLTPSEMVTNAWAEIDGVPVDVPFVEVYEGIMDGDEDSIVRLTIADEWARGSIRSGDLVHLFRLGMDGNLPVEAYGADDARAFQNPAGLKFDAPDWQEHECIALTPGHAFKPVVEVGRSAEETLIADLILDADAQFMEALGDDAFPMMVAFLAETDAIYDHEVGIKFNVVGMHMHTDPEFYPDPADEAPLGKAASYWNARDVERDVVHIFTGQDSSYAMANCIGGAGMPEEAYTFTPLNWARDYQVFHTEAFAHELGHIFNAHHHYGNHAETELATIMIQGYTPGSNPAFSSVSKGHIRGWAEEYVA